MEAATFSPLDVANTFVARHGGDLGIQHMKLQKLVYYCHGWWLSQSDAPFLDERPEVWRFGPVFAEMYHRLKGYGSQYISNPESMMPFGEPRLVDNISIAKLIDWVWGNYGSFSPIILSDKTHAKGTPWRIVAEKYDFKVPRHLKIEDDLMKQCFRGDYRQVLANQ